MIRYRNTTDNNLLYWGLDYPPLTAYHSYLVGKAAERINPDFVKLFNSRGYESDSHQFFMRMSVLISDLIFFTSALYYFVQKLNISKKHKWVLFGLCSHPGLTLIDYGHFQYNCVSLGLALWAYIFVHRGKNVLAAIAFSCALNFKQMELYHALPFFFYLLSSCQKKKSLVSQLVELVKVGLATLITFSIIWYPFLNFQDGLVFQVLNRVFPFNRGVFEDYVANFWCVLNVVVKVRRFMDASQLARYCLILTSLFSFPCALHLYFKNNVRNLVVCLINVSFAFFLFSYHVHEKSILLVALPVSLASPYMPMVAFWFLSVAHFSMLPLYAKDDIVLPAFVVIALYTFLANSSLDYDPKKSKLLAMAAAVSGIGCVVLTAVFLTCPSPPAYPYLWTLLVSVWSFIHFIAFFVYFLWVQFVSGAQSLKVKLD